MSQYKPSAEEFAAWLQDPCTIAFRTALTRNIEKAKDEWSSGRFSVGDPHYTASINAKALGGVEAFRYARDMDHETLKEVLSNEE